MEPYSAEQGTAIPVIVFDATPHPPARLRGGDGRAEVSPMPTDADLDSLREAPAPYAPPPATQRLIDELYREELIEARAMPPAEKVLAGQQLFEAACRITLAGIRNQNPGASEQECLEILRQRLRLQRRLEETS